MLAKRGNETTAVAQKKYNKKNRNTACKANIFPFYLTQAAKSYVAASHSVVRLETIEISEQRTAFIWIFAQEVDWCIKDCDKERLQTTAFINVWKIFPGYTGDWFDVKTASTCTTELWDALKSFILDSLKIKVAPHPIIVSLDTLRWSRKIFLYLMIEQTSNIELQESHFPCELIKRKRSMTYLSICTNGQDSDRH